MRPRVLRQRLILVGFGAVFAGATIGTGIAKASPDVCAELRLSPTVGTVEQLVMNFVVDGLTPGDAGEAIAISVMARCPQYRPVLERFIDAYAPHGQVMA